MYTDYSNQMVFDEEDFYYEEAERTSDIQLPPAINILLLAIWAVLSFIGLAVALLAKNPVAGAVIIAVPTFIGMVIKPTFGLCIMMLVLPTGAGIGFKQSFSLDRGVGIALAISLALNFIITRPRLRIGNKALWVMALYTVWIFLVSLAGPYIGFELMRAFTQFQLLVLILLVYLILETNGEKTFRWALRAYVIGTLGTITLAFITGAAIRVLEDTPETRYAATLGEAIDANMLAALTSTAFLAAVYLFARDRNLWRIVHFVAILFLPIMLLKIGSRGALVALVFTLLSPLLFLRQILRRPALVALLLLVILMASICAGLLIKSGGLDTTVAQRLTDIQYAKESIRYRMEPIKLSIKTVSTRPTGTGYYSWFERTGTLIWPHNDFFLALGIYGIPGALLFSLFMINLMFAIKRTPFGLEKLYTRAILIFLIVMGLTIGQLFHKYFWVFLAFVMAGERIAQLNVSPDDVETTDEYEDCSLTQYEYV